MVDQSGDGGRGKIAEGIRRREALAERLATARRQRGLSQAALAERLGVHWSYVSAMETGRQVPNVAMLRRVAGALGVSYNELAVLAGYADGVEAADEAAADGRWFAGLSPEVRRWVRRMVETHPSSGRPLLH
ncbi:MAG: helix-turn-helix domain-containing protein [Thermomicrobiales bacterium]